MDCSFNKIMYFTHFYGKMYYVKTFNWCGFPLWEIKVIILLLLSGNYIYACALRNPMGLKM